VRRRRRLAQSAVLRFGESPACPSAYTVQSPVMLRKGSLADDVSPQFFWPVDSSCELPRSFAALRMTDATLRMVCSWPFPASCRHGSKKLLTSYAQYDRLADDARMFCHDRRDPTDDFLILLCPSTICRCLCLATTIVTSKNERTKPECY
jgi:hypothetical protein